MKRLGLMLTLVAAAAGVSADALLAGQAPPPPTRKLVASVRGEAAVEITKPDTKVVGEEVVTKIRVKNVSSAPIAGFRVEENWYNKANDAIGGDSYRHPRPLQVGEVIEITLKTPRKQIIGARNQYQFSHANGTVKPKAVDKLELPKPGH